MVRYLTYEEFSEELDQEWKQWRAMRRLKIGLLCSTAMVLFIAGFTAGWLVATS